MTSYVPELPGLRLLVGITRHGSIGGSARAAGMSQQAASERLRAIEAQMGLTLVRRGARGSQLTDAGVVVAEWAARLLEVADEIDTAIDGLRGARRRDLSVWASMTVAESLMPRWLVVLRQRQLAEQASPTAVSLHAANTHDVVEAVRSGRADLGFVEGLQAPTGVRFTAVADDELVLVTVPGSPLARRRTPLSPEQVADLALTNRESGSGTREVLVAALAEHGLAMGPSVVELTTATAVREAVLAGSAPAFVSRRVVVREIESGHLVPVPTTRLALTRRFRAIWLGDRTPPAGPGRALVAIARADER